MSRTKVLVGLVLALAVIVLLQQILWQQYHQFSMQTCEKKRYQFEAEHISPQSSRQQIKQITEQANTMFLSCLRGYGLKVFLGTSPSAISK